MPHFQFNRPADGVIFDCDSTLSALEGIDRLAALVGVKEQVSKLTDQAMNGELPLEAVYHKRLELIRPTQKDIARIAEQYLENIVPGAVETIAELHQRNIRVAVISGGLYPAILPLATKLNIAEKDVFAVQVLFTPDGNYHSTVNTPLTTANGKAQVAGAWKAANHLNRVIMIGDGMSDVAALGGADAVIGYGGVIAREAVRRQATIFSEATDLRTLLPLILGTPSSEGA